VSGGQDSLCLLKLLRDLQPKWEWELAVAHCDHRWATDGGMAEWVRQIAAAWQLPFYLKAATAVRETEAAAREWRYRVLAEIAVEAGFSTVVTGHTQSDRAETLLYNLIRGSGSDGLQALSWQRPLGAGITLVRPLLAVSRQETWEFCEKWQLPVWEDRANENLNYARNRIRRQLIPYLQANFNPQVETALAQTAEVLRADVAYLEQAASQLLAQVQAPDRMAVNRYKLRDVPLALQRRVMRQFLQQCLERMPSFEQVEALVKLIVAANRAQAPSLVGGATATVCGEWIALSP
jgi:tRNA(Ile)-lysidine synthase